MGDVLEVGKYTYREGKDTLHTLRTSSMIWGNLKKLKFEKSFQKFESIMDGQYYGNMIISSLYFFFSNHLLEDDNQSKYITGGLMLCFNNYFVTLQIAPIVETGPFIPLHIFPETCIYVNYFIHFTSNNPCHYSLIPDQTLLD